MTQPNLIYLVSAAVIFLSLLCAVARPTLFLSRVLFIVYIPVGLWAVFLRYYYSFPMTPMFFGTAGTPPLLALLGAISFRRFSQPSGLFFYRSLLFLTCAVSLSQVFFPKDFYLPFLKTATFFSQAHLAFALLGKASFLLSGLLALELTLRKGDGNPARFFLYLILGFCFWTLSMFSGEAWSYLGWGLPVVWDDASIVAFLATWFFYTALLHLHLTGDFSARLRANLAAFGLIWVLAVNCLPDLGPWRFPPRF
ncbi:MAG: cytochrome c biogenesis protein [Deltaproteobacteria bacterium]|jgi:hypothetical protein|nr:cytochrome c biogenesis protein [Deltaproteobacteria bacterium]